MGHRHRRARPGRVRHRSPDRAADHARLGRLPVRDRFAGRYERPVWVDNDVNLLALGEWRSASPVGHEQRGLVKVGTGIGAGMISDGQLHRGTQGSAGDVGHVQVTTDPDVICRCGNIGCLEALAGGAALGREASGRARAGRSDPAARCAGAGRHVTAGRRACGLHGDPARSPCCSGAGQRIGLMLASIVNFFNPSLIVDRRRGGQQPATVLLARIRERSMAARCRSRREIC